MTPTLGKADKRAAAFPGDVEKLVDEMVSAVHDAVTLWGGYRDLTREALYDYAAELAQLRALRRGGSKQ